MSSGFALGVFNPSQSPIEAWWSRLRPRLTILYLAIALILLIISGTGHLRLLGEIDKTFGGFFWAINADGEVVVVSTPPQLPPFASQTGSLINNPHIVAINKKLLQDDAEAVITQIYRQSRVGDSITYTITHNGAETTVTRLIAQFTWEMWWHNYGLALLAGITWLIVGGLLLATAVEWNGAVVGITCLPLAMFFLLSSHWGNVQFAYSVNSIFQLLWFFSFALSGAAFIHLSLTYQPKTMSQARMPGSMIDGLPYFPLLALISYEWSSFIVSGRIATHIHLIVSLGYAILGGLISVGIGLHSLARIGYLPGVRLSDKQALIPASLRPRIGDLLTLWIGGIGLAFSLGVIPILLSGQPLLPLSMVYILATIYPLVLLYIIHSLYLRSRLQATLDQCEKALREQQHAAEELRLINRELKQDISLLLHTDTNLRTRLSLRIHDQPRQQALRIRSLLGHWQHKLRIEAERDPASRVEVQPIIEALGKVRKISEELERDLCGLQPLVEDAYQRRSLGLKLHLEKLICEDLPALHPESPLKVKADLWALDAFTPELERTEKGEKIAETISYMVTQALLNIYHHAGANFAILRTVYTDGILEVSITDDGRGFEPANLPPEKLPLFKTRLKVHALGGTLTIQSTRRKLPQQRTTALQSAPWQHGTIVVVRVPLPQVEHK